MEQEPKKTYKTSSLQELLSKEAKSLGASDVELTEAEKQAALNEAARIKRERMEYDQKQERTKQLEDAFRRKWTPEEMYAFVIWKAETKGYRFQVDTAIKNAVKALCLYFTNDERFERLKDGYSLNKGLMLYGSVGTGKTTLMNVFRSNQRRSFKIASCREIADRFADQGHETLHVWSRSLKVPTHSDTFFQNEIGVCFDDLGTEMVKKHYGDQVNVMEQVILNRYDKNTVPFHYTHITTNLNADEIEQYYGTRVRSRMREMFNTIIITGEDRRK